MLSSSRAKSAERCWRVRNLVLLSLLTFTLSLQAQGAGAFGVAPERIWQLSSALLIAGQVLQCVFAGVSIPREWRTEYLTENRHLLAFYALGAASIIALQGWNIFADAPGAGPFFVGLAWLLILASVHFFVLVLRGSIESS